MKRLLCWWFGCAPDFDDEGVLLDYQYGGDPKCKRCGDDVCFGDIVGDTRHNRLIEWLKNWLYSKWIPLKCEYCGRIWRKCDKSIDHIPF